MNIKILQRKELLQVPENIHIGTCSMFNGIYKLAGRIRDYNTTKSERVLGGKIVYYASTDTISDTLDYENDANS